MGYSLFTSRKLFYCNMISMINSQLDTIAQAKMNLMTLSANIADGKITAEEIASDPMNLNNYIGFIQGSDAFKQSEEGGGSAAGVVSDLMNEKQYSKEDFDAIAKLLDESLGAEYAKVQSKRLAAEETKLDLQQKRLETKLTAAQQQLQQIQEAEGRAIESATPRYAGLA